MISAQRNETENFCLFVVWFSVEFTWLFHFRCVDFIPGLRSKCMCMICSVYFIFMFSKKRNAWVSIHFCSKSIERYALAEWECTQHSDKHRQAGRQTNRKIEKLKEDDEMEKNIRHVRSIEWMLLAWNALIPLSFFLFIPFHSAQSYIFIHSHPYSNGILQFFFSLKKSAYYLRHTKLVRRNTTCHLWVCNAIGWVYVWGMVARLLVSIRCIMNNNNMQAQKCLVCFRYGQSECLNTHTERRKEKWNTNTPSVAIIQPFSMQNIFKYTLENARESERETY